MVQRGGCQRESVWRLAIKSRKGLPAKEAERAVMRTIVRLEMLGEEKEEWALGWSHSCTSQSRQEQQEENGCLVYARKRGPLVEGTKVAHQPGRFATLATPSCHAGSKWRWLSRKIVWAETSDSSQRLLSPFLAGPSEGVKCLADPSRMLPPRSSLTPSSILPLETPWSASPPSLPPLPVSLESV